MKKLILFILTFLIFIGCSSSDKKGSSGCEGEPSRKEEDKLIKQVFPCSIGNGLNELICEIPGEDINLLDNKNTLNILNTSGQAGKLEEKVKKLTNLRPSKESLSAAKYRNCMLMGRKVIEEKVYIETDTVINQAISELYEKKEK
ncbi:MAG: hypothetical protein H7A25_13145 [Leptospiraceae bacterium]|nr:hypothetical protein [Leptospiraceae bacterium]MCP5500847.1 hypothetical protein [Leptospiraceae bacterium]